jgi:hypothetical protein
MRPDRDLDGVRKVHGSVPPKDRFTEGLTSGRGYRTLIRTKKER